MSRRIRQYVKIYRQYSDSTIRCRTFCAIVNKSRGRKRVSMDLGKMKVRRLVLNSLL